MTSSPAYRFVRLSDDNLADLARLMDVVNGTPTDLTALRRKYDTRAFGGQYLGYLAYEEGQSQAAAYYGLFAMQARIDGKHHTCAQSGDTMTHPDHRGRGLFVQLARETYALAEAEQIAFVFGFPNAASSPGFRKNLGWTSGYDMVGINIFTPTVPLSLLARYLPSWGRWHRRLLYRVLGTVFEPCAAQGAAFSSVLASGADGIARDDAFFAYKRDHGLALRWGGAAFFVKYDGDICIGDIADSGDGRATRALLRRLRLIGAVLGFPRIKTYASPASALVAHLRPSGYVKQSLLYGYRDFSSGADLSKLQFTYLDYDTF